MSPRDCFGIAIRTIGVLVLFASVMYLYSASTILFVYGMPHTYPLASYLGASAVALIIGLYFLQGAPHLIRFAYPQAKPSNNVGSNA